MAQPWNLADLFELVADSVPERLALAHGEKGRERSWAELDARSNALARHLVRDHRPGDKLALYAHNRPEFLEAFLAALKARLVPVNVNYRYRSEELAYLLDDCDATVVVHEASFAENLAALRGRLPKVRQWIEIEDGSATSGFSVPFEAVVCGPSSRLEMRRSPDDLLLLYTGGTTGMPKGVMWPQAALWRALGGGGDPVRGVAPSETPEEHRERVREGRRAVRLLPVCPLMHGTGLFTALNILAAGGAVVTLAGRGFDALELWRSVEARRAAVLAIVGDAFARPMLRALDEHPGRFDLSSCRLIISSGVMWSPAVKQGLLRHLPKAALQDSFGSSEAIGFGVEVTTRESTLRLGHFQLGANCKVFTPEGEEVQPGSGVAGFVARSGPIPVGYYKDPRKTAETFRELQGRSWSIPGDWCTVNADGTLNLLGRGSVCINTGGEKVHPEEVEETLKLHPAVLDAVVVGVPDERWGEAVTALVQLRAGAAAAEAELRGHARQHLADYKTPKRVMVVESVGRSPSGKADYKGARARALEILGALPHAETAEAPSAPRGS